MDESMFGEKVQSNPLLGIVGALGGALIGAALWVVLYQIGIIASIAGIAIVVLACKGYNLLARDLDVKGVIISVLLAVVVLITAHVFCWGFEIYNVFKAEYEITIMDSILSIPDMIFTDSELLINFCKDLLIGLILIGVGAVPYIKKVFHYRNAEINSGMH